MQFCFNLRVNILFTTENRKLCPVDGVVQLQRLYPSHWLENT